jgi:hypothetical protein
MGALSNGARREGLGEFAIGWEKSCAAIRNLKITEILRLEIYFRKKQQKNYSKIINYLSKQTPRPSSPITISSKNPQRAYQQDQLRAFVRKNLS